MADRGLDSLYRGWLSSQVPYLRQSAAVAGVTPANTAIIEIPFVGRDRLAVQIVGTFTGSFKVQGTLASADQTSVGTGAAVFTVPGLDTEYTDIGSAITTPGITQINTGLYSRVRVICTALSAGNPIVRVL